MIKSHSTRPTRRDRTQRLAAIASLFIAALLLAPAAAHAKGGGVKAVLKKLDKMQGQLAEMQQQIDDMEANTTPCTLERFRNGQCGPDNHPLDLMVNVCGSVGADAGLSLKYAFTSNLDVQAGIGWKDAPDVHIVENAQLPAVIALGPIPIILPSELAAQGGASAGLGLDGCLAPIRIPVGKNLSEPVVLAILERLEARAQPVADALTAQLASGSGMGLDSLANAVAAAGAVRDQQLTGKPMDTFRNGPIAALASNLPVGDRVAALIDDPGQLALPGLHRRDRDDSDPDFGLSAPLAKLCGDDARVPALARLCEIVDERVPRADKIMNLVATLEDLPGKIIDSMSELLSPLLRPVGETADSARQKFCRSKAGQGFLFDKLCGR